MAYTINLTDGTILATVQNGTIDNTSTSITLVGKNYAGYGEFVAENFVRMLENSAKATAPAVPLTGQLWYDSSAGTLNVYNGDIFKSLAAATAQETVPTENIIGDMWFDTVNAQLNIYDGNSFILVGPAFSSGAGTSGAIVDTMVDTIAVEHIVVKLFVDDAIVGIVSKDTAFTPRLEDVVPGFTTINPGIQLATAIGAATPEFTGTATNSLSLGGELAINYLRSDENDITLGSLAIQNNAGLSVGANGDIAVTIAGTDATINNTNAGGDTFIAANGTPVITIDGGLSKATVAAPTAGTDQIANANYVDTEITTLTNASVLRNGTNDLTGVIIPDGDGTRDFGASGAQFKDMYAVTYNGNVVGNVTGNVLGDLTGDSAGFHTGDVLGNVTGNLTGNADTASNSLGAFIVNGTLTVGTPSQNASYLYMSDADEGSRILHCNSNRIGFLTQGGAWGCYADDNAYWHAAHSYSTHHGKVDNTISPHDVTGARAMRVTYTNTRGYGIYLSVRSQIVNDYRGTLECIISGLVCGDSTYAGNADYSPGGFWYIPAGATYHVRVQQGGVVHTGINENQWVEWY